MLQATDDRAYPGRAETEIGAGLEGHNRGVVHICPIGGLGSSASLNLHGRT
jgi:hypothetical protein